MHPAELDEADLLNDCEVTRTRRSGPGGQHRNKVETAIVIMHQPTGVKAEASERRSQEQNRQEAIRRLRIKLAMEVRTDRSAEQRPPDRWQARVSGGRVNVSDKHDDFPALLAIAIDAIAADAYDVASAAKRLGCSTSQLVKLLQKEPAAMAQVNCQRSRLGLRPLK